MLTEGIVDIASSYTCKVAGATTNKTTFIFFCLNLEATQFFLPIIALVSSTLRLTQFSHGKPYSVHFSLILSKTQAAVEAFFPDIKHIVRKCDVTFFEKFTTKICRHTGFIFSRPESFEPSLPTEKGWVLQC